MNSSVEKKIGVLLQYMQMALSILISFVYTPVMLRILGQSEYGIYNLVNSIISYLSLLSLGFGASYIRFYSRYKKCKDLNSIRKLNGLFMIVFLVMGTVALVCGLYLSGNVSLFFNDTYSVSQLKIARVLMIFLSFNLAFSFPNSVFTAYVTAQERFIFQKLLNMVKTVVSPLLTLPLLLLGFGSVGMVVVTTIVTVIVDALNFFFCFSKLNMSFNFRKPDCNLLKEIAIFSSFIALNQIVDQINWATDKIVLGKFCTSASVAIYAVGSQINTYYLQFSSAISSVFVTQVNRVVTNNGDEKEKNKQLTELFIKVGRVQFIVLMLILSGFISFGKFFVLNWAGEGYENSYYVTLLLIAPVTIPLIQNIGVEIQRAKNLHQFRSYIYLAMAFLNVAISIYLAKRWGEIGAALGTTLSLLLANGLIINIFYHKKVGINVIYFWKQIGKLLPALITPAIVGALLNVIKCKSIMGFAVRVLIYVVVYSASFYFFGLNDFEKDLIKKFLNKLGLRK